jgi:hypothetical protein
MPEICPTGVSCSKPWAVPYRRRRAVARRLHRHLWPAGCHSRCADTAAPAPAAHGWRAGRGGTSGPGDPPWLSCWSRAFLCLGIRASRARRRHSYGDRSTDDGASQGRRRQCRR